MNQNLLSYLFFLTQDELEKYLPSESNEEMSKKLDKRSSCIYIKEDSLCLY